MKRVGPSIQRPTEQTRALRVQVFNMPKSPDIAQITTAGHYVLATHLVRPLVKLDSRGRCHGDGLDSWLAESGGKVWTLVLREIYFSNGDRICSDDVVNSLLRQKRLRTPIHFDFKNITNITKLSDTKIQICLKQRMPDFVRDLSKPEFGILFKDDYKTDENPAGFLISSGPYSLAEKVGGTYHLSPNKYFDGEKNRAKLVFESSDSKSARERLTSGTLDFFVTQAPMDPQEHAILLKGTHRVCIKKPLIAFTFWLSLNPKSPIFKATSRRLEFINSVKKFKLNCTDGFFWEKADQLYCPEGTESLNGQEVASIWQQVAASKRSNLKEPKRLLRLIPLKIKNELTEEVVLKLKESYNVRLISYKTEEELQSVIKSNQFDVKISSNDFSSSDLGESVKTCFNAARPYIFLGNQSRLRGLIDQISTTERPKDRLKLLKEIGKVVLREGLIAPLAYLRVYYYHNKTLNLNAWSETRPEISFWKVKTTPREAEE